MIIDDTEIFESDEYGYGSEVWEDEADPVVRLPKADDYYEEWEDTEASPVNLSGQIDGKYGVSLDLYLHDDHSVNGAIRYHKYNIPIDASGRWTGAYYGDKEITVNEYTDRKVTGTFFGTYDGNTYSGTWKRADGKRQMPFSATR